MADKLTFAMAALAAAASPALADDSTDSKMEIGAFLGVHFWSDNNELGSDSPAAEALDTSPIFGVRIARRLIDSISAEGELGLSPTTTSTSGTDVVGIAYRLHLRVHPARFAGNRLEPFALLGAGGTTAASSDEDVLANDNDFVWHAGLGLAYRVGRDWGVRFDARLLLPQAREGSLTADTELLFGVFKTFPGKRPARPAPVPADSPEPSNGDGDGDGIADAADRCPTQPEDRDGHVDEDGCPDLDDDGDGIAGAADRCPDRPETANTFQDQDGCPDEPPPAVKQFTGVVRGIEFATNSDQLTAGSSKVLDQAVVVLTEYATLRLEIAGHTDDTGEPGANRDLSRRRAESVKRYLVGKGIAASRLTTVGHGADRPIANNATPDGRARNRRVEFIAR